MALLFTDGFDSYAATSDLTKKWGTAASPWTWSSSVGRSGGGGVSAATTGGSVLKTLNSSFNVTTLCEGFWFKATAAPGSISALWTPRTSGDATLGSIRINTSGQLSLYNGNPTLLVTGSINVCDGNFHWVEVYFTTGLGTQKCVVDGVQEWNGSFTLVTGSIDRFEFASITGITITLDDVICWDNSAGAPQLAQFPLGPREIRTIRPQADDTITFTTATGGSTHWDQVDEVNADGDATYVESASSGDTDLYDFGPLGVSPSTITAVMLNAYVENPNPGTINFQMVAKSGGTQTNGTAKAVPASYRIVQDAFPLDPNTTAAWASAGAIDAALFGIRVA